MSILGKAITVRQFCLWMSIIFQIHCSKLNFNCYTHTPLWSMDAAGKVPHRSPTQPDAGCGIQRSCPRVGAASEFFFFFTVTLTRLDSSRLGFYSRQFVPNRDDSARIKLYQPNQVILAGNQNGSKQPKSALNHAETAKIGFEWDPNILNLFFLNFILNICCLFCVFFFVLYFLHSSFFVL